MRRIILAVAAALVLASAGTGAQQFGDCDSYARDGDLASYAKCRLHRPVPAMEAHQSCMESCEFLDSFPSAEYRQCLRTCAMADSTPEPLYRSEARFSPEFGRQVVEWDIFLTVHSETLDCMYGEEAQRCSSCLAKCYPAQGSDSCIELCCSGCTPPEGE